jgi:serine/threonine-protein kinase
MTLVKGALLAATCGLLAIHAPAAQAQSAGAEALFRDGRALIKAGKIEAGCDKLAASEKLESSVGTLLNLGDCREKLGQTATAWAAFRKAEAMAKRAGDDQKRQTEARRRAELLEGNLSNLVIQIGPSGKATPGLVIRRDGETIDSAIFNTPVPVDPGPHTIVAEAPGYKPFKTEVSIGRGGKRFVVVPTLEREPETVTPAPAEPVTVGPAAPAPSTSTVIETHPAAPAPVATSTWTGTRIAAVTIGVLGAAAIGGGIYYGTRANDLEDRANVLCPDTVCGDATGLALNDDAQDAARNANILLVAGGAALATATVMWFIGGPEERAVVSPTFSSDGVGAAFAGRF